MLKLEVLVIGSVMIIVKAFGFLERIFSEDYIIFAWVKYLNFHNSSSALRYFSTLNG